MLPCRGARCRFGIARVWIIVAARGRESPPSRLPAVLDGAVGAGNRQGATGSSSLVVARDWDSQARLARAAACPQRSSQEPSSLLLLLLLHDIPSRSASGGCIAALSPEERARGRKDPPPPATAASILLPLAWCCTTIEKKRAVLASSLLARNFPYIGTATTQKRHLKPERSLRKREERVR